MRTLLRFCIAAALLLIAPRAWAVAVYAVTTNNEIMVVDGDVPQNILSFRPITGLGAGEDVLGIDCRPADGKLYALTASAGFTVPRIFTIDATTGAATLIAALAADPADVTAPLFTGLSGTHFAVDFNPQVDRLRIVSDTGQNLRVNVGASTALVTADTNLAYATALGQAPKINAIAYSNNNAGTVSTRLFDIDDANFKYAEQLPPNNGTLVTTSTTPTDPPKDFGDPLADHPGFDIAPQLDATGNQVGYVAGHHFPGDTQVPSREEWILVTCDPINYDPVTNPGVSHGAIGNGKIPIRDIAVATSIAFSAPLYSIFEDSGGIPTATITLTRSGFLNTPVTVQFTTLSDTASAGSDYTSVNGAIVFNATEVTKTFQVPITNDTLTEGDEFVDLVLTGITGSAVLGPPPLARLRINPSDVAGVDVTGPQVLFIGLTGPSRGIDGAVVTFNEDMDPTAAVNLANYKLTTVKRNGAMAVKTFSSAVYDPVNRRVTLGLTGFAQTDFVKMAVRVNGRGTTGVKDVNGNLLDGDRNRIRGGDAVQMFNVFSKPLGTKLRFRDRDGDLVSLDLSNSEALPNGAPTPKLDGVIPVGGPLTQRTQFWILDPIALRTSLNGSVTRTRTSDGIVVIAEIIGLDKMELTNLNTSPAFRVNTLTFSANATGIGLR
jgi:hypothetical protein